MSTEFLSPNWRMPRNANQSKSNNYSLDFTFADASYIDFGNNIPTLGYVNSTDTFSISTWVNTAWESQYVFGNRDSTSGFSFTTYPIASSPEYNGLLLRVGSTDIVATLDRNDLIYNSWVHFVWVYDGSGTNNSDKIKAYQNGIPLSLTFPFGNFPSTISSNLNFYAGAYTWTGTLVGQYEGGLNELSIFDYALSESQVTTLYGDSTNGQGNPMALPSSPVAHYPLGESAGGFVGGTGTWLTENNAIGDYVFDFDGNDDYLGITSTDFKGSSGTVSYSFWVKPNTYSGNNFGYFLSNSSTRGGIAYSEGGTSIGTTAGQMYLYNMTNSGALTITSTFIDENVWNHIVVVFNTGNIVQFYKNGTPSSTLTGITSFDATWDTIAVQRSPNSGASNPLNGYLSNIAFWNVGLTSTQVETLYNYGSPIQTLANIPQNSNLKAWYKLDASEIYNGTSTEWSVDNNKYPSAYPSSLNFNPNSYIDTNFTLPNYSDYSYSFWIKNTGGTSGSDQWILGNSSASVSGDTGFRGAVRINNSTKIRIFGGDDTNYYRKQYDFTAGNAQGNTNIFNGGWYNIVVTFTSGTIVFYVNGIAQTQEWNTNTPITGFAANNSYRIGQSGVNTGYLNHSLLSNFQIFNTELSAPDAVTLYNNGTPLTDMSSFSSLVSWWKLDNTTTGIGNYLSNYTTAVDFNYLDTDYLSLGTMSTLSAEAEVTFSIWAKITKPGGTQGFSMIYTDNSDGGTGNKGTIYIEPSGYNARVKCTLRNTSSLMTSLVNHTTFNSWHNITVTFGTTYARLYLNGQLQDTEAVGTAANLGVNAFLGRYSSTSPVYATGGLLSNFAIFNSELSGPQVLTLFNGGTPETSISFSPVHHWKLNDINTGLNDIGSLASNNATRGAAAPGTVGSGPTTASSLVSSLSGTNNGATEYPGFVNTLAGDSTGMDQSNLVQSDLQTVAPYSKYAMSFDGTDSLTVGSLFGQVQDVFSVSTWVNFTSNPGYQMILSDNIWLANYTANNIGLDIKNSSGNYYDNNGGLSQGTNFVIPSDLRTNEWINVAFSYVGSSSGTTAVIKMYLNGAEVVSTTVTYSTGNANLQNASNVYLGSRNGSSQFLDGSISNVSIWNVALTASQIREIYNEGLPSNLHNFSGTAPVAWWQLGENSSFNGNDWIVADEIGSNNGESNGMGVDALTNGVGTTANGTSTGMSEGSLVGDAPYSTANAVSSGMPVTARGIDVPS